jgi:hypothetical protein
MLSDVPYMWSVPVNLFDGALLRVDGRETKEVVGTRREPRGGRRQRLAM